MNDIIIIGAGPAGLTSAIYALRAGKKIKIFESETIGGHITSSPLVSNYPGLMDVSGIQIADSLYNQVINLGGEIDLETVLKIENLKDCKRVTTDYGIYDAKTIIIATGTIYRTLGLENEEELIGNGISFCVTCDAPFYENKTVAVIGGANSAVVNAIELAKRCKKVYLIYRKDKLKADYNDIKKLESLDNVEIIYNSNVTKYNGENSLESIVINDERVVELDGLFLAIGQLPNLNIINTLDVDEKGYAISNNNGQTNIEGIYVAGDVRSKKVRQLTTATSDGTICALEAIKYLDKLENS